MEKPWFKFWPEKVRKHIDYPEIPLFEFLRKTAEKYPFKTALVYFHREITYKELDLLTDKFATALDSLGVKKSDKVAIFLPNVPQFIIAYYGAIKIGAIATAISPLYKEREVEHQLNDSEAETIVVLDLLYPIIEKVWSKTKLKHVIVTGLKDYMPKATAVLGSLLKKIPQQKVERKPNVYFFTELINKYEAKPPSVEINPKEDLVALQYTGGTTGTSKGAMLTHMNLVSNALMCAEWLQGDEAEETFLAVLPLFHIYGMTTGMNAPIHLAGRIVLLPRFDPVSTFKAIQNYRVTVFCGAPTMYAMLLAHPDLKKYDCTSVRFCISGSAPLPPEVQKKFMEVTGGVLVEGYGLTESSPVTHCNPLDKSMKTVKIGSIGIPWPDTDAKIMDLETGEKELAPGEIGELVVKGPQVMKGYWKMPEETAEVLRNGWLYTGDIGKIDEDGYFYITDRKKDLIKYKGYSVYPRELEDVLYEHPAVKLCGVIGKPDPVAGEIPKAFIVLKEGKTATEKEIMDFVNEKVAPYKAIREVEFRTELPMTLVGKVLRRVLQEEEKQKLAKT
ncbi:MAG: long-chain fatty acid--CoA ligase [Candidatus Bathyarchaeota archaeon]|nr:long-chain fatty acid--CoA ligase [Candidatus Bathyarchaeota archaeon A05DMB-5]MDH7557628.1 long-chain fatty acid--CoA ligase [Candidatus Bathyarchaeota archaeon]